MKVSDEDIPPELLAKIPPESEQGPAFRKLGTLKQKLFVLALVEQGTKTNLTAAALASGYKGGVGARVTAHHLAHNPAVLAAILEVAKNRMKFSTMAAEGLLSEFVQDVNLDPRIRLAAANSILDRGGLNPVFESRVTHEHQLGREEKLIRLAELAQRQGKDIREVLGNLIDALPSDFKVIDEQEADA